MQHTPLTDYAVCAIEAGGETTYLPRSACPMCAIANAEMWLEKGKPDKALDVLRFYRLSEARALVTIETDRDDPWCEPPDEESAVRHYTVKATAKEE